VPSVVILTEAGDGIGYGHLSRMQALFDAFEYLYEIRPTLVVGSLAKPLSLQDMETAKDIAIVDSYLAPLEFYERVSKKAKLAVFIDDFDRLEYPKGLVVKPKILRKPFWQAPSFCPHDEVSSILITIGGLDTHNTMPKLIKTARKTYPNARIKAVISPSFANIDDINSVSDERVELLSDLSAQDMQELMSASDIAISGGGQTLCELCACGVPTLVIEMADNQKTNIADLESKEAIAYVCEVLNIALESKLAEVLAKMRDVGTRAKMSQCAKDASDTGGAIELAKKLTEAVCHK